MHPLIAYLIFMAVLMVAIIITLNKNSDPPEDYSDRWVKFKNKKKE